MKRFIFILLFVISSRNLSAQESKYVSVGFLSAQTDYPFSKLSGLVSPLLHPGIELGYGRSIGQKPKREWFLDFRLAYFFHRFVQHGIPLTANFGYRRRFGRFFAETSIGAGYMHSIPATGQYKLEENGEYRPGKGIGRAQGTANFDLGAGYRLSKKSKKPVSIFLLYEQRLQFPFVRSYVPILPYNNLQLGIRKPFTSSTKNQVK